jgi:hypothetical protein
MNTESKQTLKKHISELERVLYLSTNLSNNLKNMLKEVLERYKDAIPEDDFVWLPPFIPTVLKNKDGSITVYPFWASKCPDGCSVLLSKDGIMYVIKENATTRYTIIRQVSIEEYLENDVKPDDLFYIAWSLVDDFTRRYKWKSYA